MDKKILICEFQELTRDKIWHNIPAESSNNHCAKTTFGQIDFSTCCDMEKR